MLLRIYVIASVADAVLFLYFFIQAINSEIFVGYENHLYVKIVLRNSPYIFNIPVILNNFNRNDAGFVLLVLCFGEMCFFSTILVIKE